MDMQRRAAFAALGIIVCLALGACDRPVANGADGAAGTSEGSAGGGRGGTNASGGTAAGGQGGPQGLGGTAAGGRGMAAGGQGGPHGPECVIGGVVTNCPPGCPNGDCSPRGGTTGTAAIGGGGGFGGTGAGGTIGTGGTQPSTGSGGSGAGGGAGGGGAGGSGDLAAACASCMVTPGPAPSSEVEMSWECFCAMYPAACARQMPACTPGVTRTVHPSCGLTVDRSPNSFGSATRVYDSSGALVGVGEATDVPQYACPSDPSMRAFRLKAGRSPDATCPGQICSCGDGGATCP